MHELPVTLGLYDAAIKAAEEQHAKRINSITIKMGQSCDYVAEIIQEYFSMVAEGSIAEKAVIHAHYIETTVICKDCGREFTRHEFKDVCPFCGSTHLKLNAFSDLYIESMEVE